MSKHWTDAMEAPRSRAKVETDRIEWRSRQARRIRAWRKRIGWAERERARRALAIKDHGVVLPVYVSELLCRWLDKVRSNDMAVTPLCDVFIDAREWVLSYTGDTDIADHIKTRGLAAFLRSHGWRLVRHGAGMAVDGYYKTM